MRLVEPRAEVGLRRRRARRVRDDRLEQHDAGREVRRRDDADAGRRRPPRADGRLVRAPAGRADDDVDAAAAPAPARSRRTASGDEKSMATSTSRQRSPSGAAGAGGDVGVDRRPRPRSPYSRRERPRRAGPSGRSRPAECCIIGLRFRAHRRHRKAFVTFVLVVSLTAALERTASCRRVIACGTSASRSTNVMFRRDAACDTRRSGIRSSAVTARPNSVGSARRFSPTAQTIAISGSHATSAKRPEVVDDRVEPARVVHRHRHAHLGGRHHVDRRLEALEHLEQPPQEAVRHQHARRRDVDDRDVALAGERRELAVAGARLRRDERAGFSGRRELRIRTGMFFATAGRIVLGCSTFAPKYASSDASANESCGHDLRLAARCADRPSACRRRRSRSESRPTPRHAPTIAAE